MGLRNPVLLGWPAVSSVRQEPPRPCVSADALGYGQGLTFYSWTSDQLSQYGSKPVIITARDATYVLDAILGNETELAILEHTTDTAGATEIIFALFDLLGLRFTPRLRDIGSRPG
jgi:TnpA family transposase